MVTSAVAGQPIVWPTATKMTILVVVVVAMFFTWRPWCTLFCPLGAIYALLNHVSFLVPSLSSRSLHRLRRLPESVPRRRNSRAPHRRAALRPLHGMHQAAAR